MDDAINLAREVGFSGIKLPWRNEGRSPQT
jgi:hypothetical protein